MSLKAVAKKLNIKLEASEERKNALYEKAISYTGHDEKVTAELWEAQNNAVREFHKLRTLSVAADKAARK